MMSVSDYLKKVPELPGKATSLWLDTTDTGGFPIYEGEGEADVVIVGGGLVGILTAFLLASAKRSVILLEAGEVGALVTGHSTAKLTSQHGLMYSGLNKRFGLEVAKTYGKAQEAGIKLIDSIVHGYDLKCDYLKTSAYLYTSDYEIRKKILEEVRICEKIELPVEFRQEAPLDYKTLATEVFTNQAQFHPRKFMMELLPHILKLGTKVYEHSRVTSFEDGDVCEVATEKGRIIAKKLIIATHYPAYDTGNFYTKLYPYRSYVLAGTIEGSVPEGMFYEIKDNNNYFSFRPQGLGMDKIMLFGGERHYAGRIENHIDSYKSLDKQIREKFKFKEIFYHWSTQDNFTPDSLPYIGRSPRTKNTYIATGFGGWGISNSAAAALVLHNLILGKDDGSASQIFSPNRFGRQAIPTFLRANLKSALHVVRDRLRKEKFSFVADLHPGEGKILETKKIKKWPSIKIKKAN
jgi:glycine/D-amino acid oxidase-like deaminating enzyme